MSRRRRMRGLGIDDDQKTTLRDGLTQAYRLLLWFRAGPDGGAVEPPVMRGPPTAGTLAVAAVALVVVVLVVLGVIEVMLKVVEYGVGPMLAYLSGPLFRLLAVPQVLPVVGLAVLAIGLVFGRKFRPADQGLFVMGLVCVGLGFVCLWQLPRLMAALTTPEARVELEGPLLIVGLIISGFLIVCGLELIGRGRWVRRQEVSDEDE